MSWNESLNINNLIYRLPNSITSLNTLNVSQNSTFMSNLNINGVLSAVTGVVTLSIITNVSTLNVSETTKLNGSTSIISSLNVSGNVNLNSNLIATSGLSNFDDVIINNNLLVSGLSNFQDILNNGPLTNLSNLTISGPGVFESSLLIKNNISANTNLNVSGNAILESGLLVKQNQTNLSSLNVSGQTNLSAPLNFINGPNILNNGTPVIYPNSNDIYFENSGTGSLVALHQANDGPTKPVFKTYTNLNGPDGTYSQVVKDSISPSNNDDLGGWCYIGNNSNNQKKEYARINVNSDSVSNNTEVGSIHFLNMNNGNLIENMNIKNNEVNINNNLNITGSSIIGNSNVGTGKLRVLGSSSIADFRGTTDETFIAIGNNNTLSSAIYLGYESSTSQLVIGQRATTRYIMMNTSGNSNIGIHTNNPQATLHISGSSIINQNLTLSSITNASVLGTNSSGQIVASSAPTSLTITGDSTTNSNLFLPFTNASTGSINSLRVGGVSYNPSQDTLYCNNFDGVASNALSSFSTFRVEVNSNTTATTFRNVLLTDFSENLTNPSKLITIDGNTNSLSYQITSGTLLTKRMNAINGLNIGTTSGSSIFNVLDSNNIIGSFRKTTNTGDAIIEVGRNTTASAIYVGWEASNPTVGYRATAPNITLNTNGSINATVAGPSDRRIKKDIRDIDDGEALEKIRLLQPKKYKYIDNARVGDRDVYGFIAQEVKEVLPEAVKSDVNYFIPNIYSEFDYNYENKIIQYPNHNLTNNNLIKCKYNELYFNSEIEIINENEIKILSNEKILSDVNLNKIFIFGICVNDFNMLDKNYIFAVNVSATQELDKLLQQNTQIINQLKLRIEILENEIKLLKG